MCPRARKRYARDYTDEELRAQARDLECALTIPVNVEIEADHMVLDLGEIEKILKKARRIGLQDCGCRTEKRNCSAPMHVCISIDPATDYTTRFVQYNAHECTLDEALSALRTSHEGGLVHMAYTMKGEESISLVCSCCPCCCPTLGGLLRHGIATQVLTSRFVAEQDYDRCKACRKCADRCVFGAREFKEGRLQYDRSRCFGCGLCVSTCPSSAITLAPRREQLSPTRAMFSSNSATATFEVKAKPCSVEQADFQR